MERILSAVHAAALILLVCASGGAAATRGSDEESIEGLWLGVLQIPDGPALRFVFEIHPRADGQLTATLMSIDQGGHGYPADEVTVTGRTVRLTVAAAELVYEGRLGEDNRTLVGTITQLGGSLTLDMERVAEVPGLPRPQTPPRPYPYHVEDVVYTSADGVALAGTFTRPGAAGRYPAALLISGSGAQDRDETMFYHHPFLVLADHLTRHGLAVLRVDDRGFGASTGQVSGDNTPAVLAGDVRAGVAYLKSRADVDLSQIGLVGHSEGGMVAPMVAAESPDVAFIVLLAGPGVPGDDMLLLQLAGNLRAEGVSEETIAVLQDWWQHMFTIVGEEAADAQAERRTRDAYAQLSRAERSVLSQFGWCEAKLSATISEIITPWYRDVLAHDPAPVLAAVACPVLAVNGERDVQVLPRENLEGIEAALRTGGNQDFTVLELPRLNHLFQTAGTGAVSEYMGISETMSPILLDLVVEWIRAHTGPGSPATVVAAESTRPGARSPVLCQNHPNPFNSSTVIRFTIGRRSESELGLYNLAGQQVATLLEGVREAGTYSVCWDGRSSAGKHLASGVYLYRLRTGDHIETRALVLLR